MSSFTSNFRSEGRVLLTLLAVAVGMEVALRVTSASLSTDISQIRGIPAIASAMASARGRSVLFLGNSLTKAGLDAPAVCAELRCPDGSPMVCDRVSPDDTTVLDWYYLVRHYFDEGRAPSYLVVGYARGQLEDRTPIQPGRIAANFGGWSSAAEMWKTDLTTLSERFSYLLASSSYLFSEPRERVQVWVLRLLIPDYRKVANSVNEAAQRREAQLRGAEPEQYSRLSRLLALCAERGVRVVFVAMPVRSNYRLDPGLQAVLDRGSAGFIDLRQIEGVDKESFVDNLHLTPSGKSLYSRALGRQLRAVIADCSTPASTAARTSP
jgi:hypothetical protein